MTDVQQDTPATAAATDARVQRDGAVATSPIPQDHLQREREQLASRQAKLDQHRDSVIKGMTGLNGQLAKVAEHDVTKRLSIRGKVKVLEDQLALIAEEQASLDRQKDSLEKEIQEAQIEQEAAARRQIQDEGRVAAAKLHACLAVGSQLFQDLLELGDGDRIAKDRLRSIAPDRMTECPDFFSYEGSGVAPDLKAVFAQTFGELGRWNRELQRREQARVAAPGGVPTGGS